MFFMNKEAQNGGGKARLVQARTAGKSCWEKCRQGARGGRGTSEQLAIFGARRSRRGAELKAPRNSRREPKKSGHSPTVFSDHERRGDKESRRLHPGSPREVQLC